MSQELTFSVPTLFGVEGLTADELRRLGLDQVRAENGRGVLPGRRPGPRPSEFEPAHRGAGAAGAGLLPGRRLRRPV